MEVSVKFTIKAEIGGVVTINLPDTLTLHQLPSTVEGKLSEVLKNILADGVKDVSVLVDRIVSKETSVLDPIEEVPSDICPADLCTGCSSSIGHCACRRL